MEKGKNSILTSEKKKKKHAGKELDPYLKNKTKQNKQGTRSLLKKQNKTKTKKQGKAKVKNSILTLTFEKKITK